MTKDKDIALNAVTRLEKDGKLEKIESKEFVPAVMYGSGSKNKNLKIKKQELAKAYEKAGESNLIDLNLDGKDTEKVLIKDVQFDPVKDDFLHIDFYKVDMTKKITTEIPLKFIGEPKAIKDLNGVMIKNMDSVEVECLPGDLVDHIEVDISVLNTFDDSIMMGDLKLPEGMELTQETNDMVVTVSEPRIQEEEEVKSEETEGEDEAENKEGKGEDKKEEATQEKKEEKETEDKK